MIYIILKLTLLYGYLISIISSLFLFLAFYEMIYNTISKHLFKFEIIYKFDKENQTTRYLCIYNNKTQFFIKKTHNLKIKNNSIYKIKYNGIYELETIKNCDDIYFENLNKIFNKDISNLIFNYL
jgi:hypothetical protein